MKRRKIAFVLFLILVLSVLYVFFGKNWFVEQHNIAKQKNSEFIKNDLMQKFLDIQAQSQELLNEILQQNYELELFPNKKLEIIEDWKIAFGKKISGTPIFDYKHIYIASDNYVFAFKKKNMDAVWKCELDQEIYKTELLDANRILITSKTAVFCLNRDSGKKIWSKEFICEQNVMSAQRIFQISLEKYKSLDNSIILMNSGNEIILLNNITGEETLTYKTENEIKFISDFDITERCIYYTDSKNNIYKAVIKIII